MPAKVWGYVLLVLVDGNLLPRAFASEVKSIEPTQTENLNTEQNFPDPSFRRLVEEAVEVGPGEPFTAEQVLQVTELHVAGGIRDLTGLRFFPHLKKLNCSFNQLTTLDLSHNPALEELDCWWNFGLTALNLPGNPALRWLDCNSGQLTTLDLSHCPALEEVHCAHNRLTALEVRNPALARLWCSDNQLPTLDVSDNPALSSLDCYQNQLIALDLTQNPALTSLDCSGNRLIALDLSQNPNLGILGCSSNQLTTLDLSLNPALTDLDCSYNQLTALDLSHNPALYMLNCGNNLLTDLSGWVANLGSTWAPKTALEWGGKVDITRNRLDRRDCSDIQALRRKGIILTYSPQRRGEEEAILDCALTEVPGWAGY